MKFSVNADGTHAHTHTHLLRLVPIEFWCEMHPSCKNTSVTPDRRVWCGVEGKFFRRHLEEWNKINRSHEELRNIRRKLEWTRDSPQSQIAPTVQNDTWEVTFIRSCAEFKNIQKSCCDSRWKTAWWFLGWPHPITIQKIAGTFAQQLGWVFVGPCHPSAHGPPATNKVQVLHLLRCLTHTHKTNIIDITWHNISNPVGGKPR